MVSQIVVSVTAAVCVGLITNAYFGRTPASQQPAAVEVAESAAADAVGQATAEPAAAAPIRIIDGTSSTSFRTGGPARPLAPATEAPVLDATASAVLQPSEPAAAGLPPLTSETIADLPVRDTASTDAEIFPGVPAESALADSLRSEPAEEEKPERRRFLWLPLPYFVPTAGDIFQSASAAGEKIVSLVER
jgi:hypothetical protein